MFITLRSEVQTRFIELESFLSSTKSLHESHAAMAKGLMFVQIYAVYEHTINRTISEAIDAIKVHNHKMEDITPSLLALFLDPELQSLRSSQRKNEWHARLHLLERASSREKLKLSSDTNPPSDGSHYRYSHLVLIFKVFGIRRMPVPRRRHVQRISEVVDNRNAIAHGREASQDVGRRYTQLDIKKIINQMRAICVLWGF